MWKTWVVERPLATSTNQFSYVQGLLEVALTVRLPEASDVHVVGANEILGFPADGV